MWCECHVVVVVVVVVIVIVRDRVKGWSFTVMLLWNRVLACDHLFVVIYQHTYQEIIYFCVVAGDL